MKKKRQYDSHSRRLDAYIRLFLEECFFSGCGNFASTSYAILNLRSFELKRETNLNGSRGNISFKYLKSERFMSAQHYFDAIRDMRQQCQPRKVSVALFNHSLSINSLQNENLTQSAGKQHKIQNGGKIFGKSETIFHKA